MTETTHFTYESSGDVFGGAFRASIRFDAASRTWTTTVTPLFLDGTADTRWIRSMRTDSPTLARIARALSLTPADRVLAYHTLHITAAATGSCRQQWTDLCASGRAWAGIQQR